MIVGAIGKFMGSATGVYTDIAVATIPVFYNGSNWIVR